MSDNPGDSMRQESLATENGSKATETPEELKREGIGRFHDGELGICPRCGRRVFLPCLSCRIEQSIMAQDHRRRLQGAPDKLRLQLRKDDRRRYLRVRREHEQAVLEGRIVD